MVLDEESGRWAVVRVDRFDWFPSTCQIQTGRRGATIFLHKSIAEWAEAEGKIEIIEKPPSAKLDEFYRPSPCSS